MSVDNRVAVEITTRIAAPKRTEYVVWALRSTEASSPPSDIVRVPHAHGRVDIL